MLFRKSEVREKRLNVNHTSLSSPVYPLLPTLCRRKGLLLLLITISDTKTYTNTHTHTQGRISLDEGSGRCGKLCLTKHNIHKRQTATNPARFETAIPANERPPTYALDRAASGIGHTLLRGVN